jgi:hypothetical protein
MEYSAATRAFKAINSAVDDIEKRRKKEGESFTYEPWAVPSEEEQSIRAAQVNQRYADIAQNGPDAAAIAGREAMKNLQAQQKYLQYQREMEEQRNNRLLQNGFTQGDINASNMYRNASPAQKSALENIYTAQSMTPSGGDRYSGYTTSDYMANQFKKDNSVDDEAYKNLMAGYKAYRAQQALAAQDSYSGITDEQKKELSQIGKMQSTGGVLNGITGKTKQSQQEAQNLADQFKKKYGVDDATYSTWQGMNDQEQADKEAAEEASKSGKRTYSQELEYAENVFKTKGKNNSDSLRTDISRYNSMVSEAKMQKSSGLAESASNIQTDFGEQAQKDADSFRESVKKKYGLSDNDIDDLSYYGKELDDYSNRQQQKQEAYNNVHQDSTAKNILGGIKNTATALTLNPYAGIGAIGETAKYYGGGYRDKKSPMNVNSAAFGASNATTDYQSTTQEALNNKSKVLGTLYGAGMSAAESAETGTLGGAVNGTGLGARVARSALSLAPFGANAYASSISQNVADKNQSQGKAMANALASAGVEVATEIASADKFWDIFKNHNATARKKIIDFLVSSGIEGTEEVVGDIADNFIDAALNGKNSEYNQSVRDYMKQGMSAENAKRQATKDTLSDTANSFVTGALSGAMGAGIATASGYANDAYNSKTMFDGYTKEDYAQWAEGLDTDPTHYKNASTAQSAEMAKSLAEKMAQEDNATPRQKRELYEYYQDMQNTEMEAAAESEEKENRKDKIEGIKNKVGSFFGRNEATEGQQAAKQTKTTESADTQKTAMVEPQNVPEEHHTQSTDIAPNDAYAKMAAAQNGEELRNAYQEAVHSTNEETREHADSDLQIVSGMLQKRGISAEEIESAKISTEDAYAAGYSGQEISENVPATVKIAYNDGQKQAIEDRARQTFEARDSVKRTAAKQMTDGARTIIEANYKDGMNASAYNDVMSSAINAGRTGMSYENYLKKAGSSVSIVGEDLAKKAYAAGLQVSVNDAVKESARSMSEKTGVKTFGTGTFTDARSNTSEAFSGASVMQAVAKMTGLNVVLTDQNFREGENGYYKSGNSTIYINSEQAENAASTLFHEVGEFASVWNQKEYAGVVSDIMKTSQDVLGTRAFNNIRQKYVNAYLGEEGKTDADVDKEMANDLIYQFLGNEKGMNKLMDQIDQNHGYKEAKSIKQKLADWVGHMVESIKNFLSDLNPNSYQRKMAEANLQNYEELQDAIVKSIANAEKSYSEAKAQSQQDVATDESAKRKSIEVLPDTINDDIEDNIRNFGDMKPVIDVPNNAFERGEKKLSEQVKEYFLENSNNGIVYGNVIGDVDIVAGIKSDIAHGVGRMKAMAFYAVPETIKKGVIVDYQKNRKQRGYDSLLLAAPIRIQNEAGNFENAVEMVAINRSNTDVQKFYFHEAFIINEDESLFKNGRPNRSLPVNDSSSSVYSIAQRLIKGNGEGNSVNVDSDTKRMSKQIQEVQDEIADTKEKRDLTGDEKIEKTEDFIAVHNLTMDQLMKDINMGGFPSPSIAIIRSAMQHTRYGDVSVIFNRDTIDPERSKANKVYGGDAWTPTFPGIEYDVNEDKYYSVMHSVDDAMKGKVPEYLRAEAKRFNTSGMNSTAEKGGVDAVVEKAKDNYGMKAAYLASKGETIEDQVHQKEVRKYDDEKANRFDKMEEAIAPVEDEFLKDRSVLSARDMLQKYGGQIQQAYEAYAETVPEDQKKRWTGRVKRANEKAFFAHNIIDDITNAIDYYNNGNESHTENERDEAAIEKQIDSKVDPEAYDAWLRETYDGLIRDEGIYNGKDPFTASGTRKSFRQMHYAVTLENIVRAMNEAGAKAVGTFGGISAVREEAVKDFSSVAEMHQNEGMLRTMNQDEYRNMEGEYINQIRQISHRIARSGQNSLIQDDNAADAILDAVRTRKTAAGIEKALKSYGMNVYEGVGNDILNLMHKISEMPTEYFEAKPQRAVGLDEIAMVVAPDTITKEQTRALNENRIPLQTYEAGNEDARHQVIENLQDVRFSRPVQDSEGRNLSEGQQEFFKDSKLKDEYGRLLVMYHGTPQGGFTVFKPDISYFTANRDYAEEYARASSGNSRVNYTHDPEHKVYEVYLNAKKPFDTRDPKVRKVWEQEFFGKYSRTPLTDRGLLDWTDGYDIWDFIDDNDLDYDAVLLDEGSVPNGNGGTKWRGISYTVRDKNQIKNVDNKTPTDDSDIRRDIGIDDYVTDQELWSDHYDTKKSLIEVLRSGNEILKNSDIDETAVRRIAREIKEQYHSNIDVNELAENLAKVFRYAQGQNYIDYDDLATVISEVAFPVIDGSVTKVGAEEFKQFKTALQGATYNLDSKQEAEVVSAFGSWGNFRKAIPGVKFTRDGSGVSLDGVWSTLVQDTGYVLDMDTSSNDMPLALVDAYNSMKPEYQNAFGEDATQAAQDVAMEIVARYYQYSAGQEKLKLKAKQKQELLDQARRMAASNAAYRKKIKQEYQKRYEEELSKVRQSGGRSETVSKQVARLRAKNARTVASIREQQKRKDELRMLKTPVKSLMDMLTGPTDKKHVPALVQTPVLQLASAFDFVPQTVRETADGKFSIRILESRDINADGSYSYKWRTIHADSRADAIAQYKKAMEENGLGSAENKSWQERLRAIQDLYQQDEGDDWFERSELKQGLDKELGEKLGEILRKNQGTISIAQLSSDELKTLNAVVRNVLHSINQMNRMYSQPSKQVSDIAHMAMDRTTSGVKGRREHFKPVATLVDTLTLDHASPETYFHGIFGGENTDPVTKTLIGAQNKKARDIRQASEYMKGVRDKVGVKPKNLESWMKETKNYYGLNLTTTQVMSLYELSKRPDAQQHKIGGFVADEASRKTVSGQRLPVQLTDAQIKAITDTLTPQQKQMADAMQYYLAHQCAEQGNETCMQLYGYEKFVDEHYFPMTTDKNTIATRDSNVTQGAINAIKNSGFTKDITPNASNPLVLRDIFAVYSDHVAQMATYHAWAAPIQDIIRFFNYSEKTDVKVDGQTFTGRNSVKDAIDFFYGKSGQEYFVKLLSSINDREKSSFVGGDFYDLMTGHAKTAAVMGNLRVIIQQPTAIFRAGEMISYKYLNEGMAGKYRKEAAELRDRTSDVFWLKNQGNIDGYITQSLVSTITGVKTTREKINDFAGNPASKADEITWAAMYRAVYAEQVDKLGKEKIGTKEFEDAVNDRFSEIVLRTQVYDGIITRSQFMRSPDKWNRAMSAFMAEPVKTYNMILRDTIDISQATDERQVKKAVAHLVRITAPVLLITNAVNAVAQSFVDALRSEGDPDDEDKDFLRLFMDALGFGNWLDEDASFNDKAWEFLSGNLVDGMDLLSNIPMVAQYWDATKEGVKSVLGESTYSSDSDLSMSGVKNFFKAVKAIVNPSEKMTTYGKVAALTRAFSDLSGYPLYAAQRDVVAIYNTVASQIFKQLPVLQKATKYTPKKQAKLDVYTAALESGGDYKKAIEDAVAQGNDYKAISKGISDSYKDTYLALKETNPNEAIKMKNRLVTLYVYLSDKAGTNKDKTTSEKTKYYSDNIDKWK